MARRRISHTEGTAAVRRWANTVDDTSHNATASLDRGTRATAVRFLLEELAERAPGNSVEVRVPPLGVTQCIEGPRHTRGTPPNVVELDTHTWLQLATGRLSWEQAEQQGSISASGIRADLGSVLPLIRL